MSRRPNAPKARNPSLARTLHSALHIRARPADDVSFATSHIGPLGCPADAAFRRYWMARLAAAFATQIQVVAVGWQVYDLTRNPLDLGFVGLSQFMPALCSCSSPELPPTVFAAAPSWRSAWRSKRSARSALLLFTLSGTTNVAIVLPSSSVFGTARAFFGPAQQSLLPNIVPPEILSNAIAMNSLSWQIATIAGPVAGGLLYGIAPEAAYGATVVLMALAAVLVLLHSPHAAEDGG